MTTDWMRPRRKCAVHLVCNMAHRRRRNQRLLYLRQVVRTDHLAVFVRDREVPVTVIRRDENSGTNQLEAARQTIRSLMAAKQEAERLLGEAQTAIRDLQTKLAHERLARDEAVSRADTDRQASEQTLQAVQANLAGERGARRQAEQGLAEALEARQEAVERLRDMVAAQAVRAPSQVSVKGR